MGRVLTFRFAFACTEAGRKEIFVRDQGSPENKVGLVSEINVSHFDCNPIFVVLHKVRTYSPFIPMLTFLQCKEECG